MNGEAVVRVHSASHAAVRGAAPPAGRAARAGLLLSDGARPPPRALAIRMAAGRDLPKLEQFQHHGGDGERSGRPQPRAGVISLAVIS